jgi:diadenosine tetraphosphate (Ap4A) HIT family hydrolase
VTAGPPVSGNDCPFCKRLRGHELLLASRPLAVGFADAFPVSPGHCLVIPRRHEADFFALSREEQEAVWDIVWELRELLEAEHGTTAFNVGINAGEAAGQTVPHAHVHVIPRYPGDDPDPRGGVRWVLPDKARYWE